MERIKRYAIHGRGDLHRPAKLFRAGGDVEGVQPVNVGHILPLNFLGSRNHIERFAGSINDGSSGDADDRVHVTNCGVLARHRNNVGRGGEVYLPERVRSRDVCIESIHAVIFGCHEHHIVNPHLCHPQPRPIQRLSINLSIHGIRTLLAKAVEVYIDRGERGFPQVLTGVSVVIVPGDDPERSGGRAKWMGHHSPRQQHNCYASEQADT